MIIGISGKIGSGKDTVGKIIQYLTWRANNKTSYSIKEYLEINKTTLDECCSLSPFKIKKFADKLKDIVCLLINCTREQLEDADFKNTELGEEWNIWMPFSERGNKFIGDMFLTKEFCEHNIKKYHTIMIEDNVIPKIRKLTPRLLLQLLGTNCGRDIIHPNIWVNSLFSEYKLDNCLELKTKFYNDRGHDFNKLKLENKELYQELKVLYFEETNKLLPNWIITDTRFPNELEAVKNRGGISIRVKKPKPFIKDNDKLTEQVLNQTKNFGIEEHPSETALDNAEFDYSIDNNGTIEELIDKVKEILIKEKII